MIVSVIEVGSSATRLLVCETDGQTMTILHSQAELLRLTTPTTRTMALEQVQSIKEVVRRYCEKAKFHNCDKDIVFGTQSVRNLVTMYGSLLQQEIPNLHVMPSEEEALSSFITCGSYRERTKSTLTVIDFGSKSIEIVSGNQSKMSNIQTASIPFSVDEFGVQKNPETVKRTINNFVKYLKPIDLSFASHTSVDLMGSVFTNIVWVVMNLEAKQPEKYSPQLVEGYVWMTEKFKKLIAGMLTNKAILQFFLDAIDKVYPGKKREKVKLLNGLLFTLVLFNKIGISSAIVSTQGTRHGVAKLVAQGYFDQV